MTREEYEKTYVRMMDSLRGDIHKGDRGCNGVDCKNCPLGPICDTYETSNSSTFKAAQYIEIVEKWGKEHPIVTNADKFKEVFGREPKKKSGDYNSGDYICPRYFNVVSDQCPDTSCERCTKGFWESEYVAPKGE